MPAADLKTSLYTLLSTDGSITALVGTRSYPNWAPASAVLPYIVFSRIDQNDFAPTLAGASVTDFSVMQFDVWGISSLQVDTIVDAMRTLLDGFIGSMSPAFVCNSQFTSTFDGPLAPSDGGEEPTARATVTAEFIYA